MGGLKKKILTVILYIIAGILLTWALWLGPAPRQNGQRPAFSPEAPTRPLPPGPDQAP